MTDCIDPSRVIRTVECDGWDAVRAAVFARDLDCVATQPRIFGRDTAPDRCEGPIEFDHVRETIGGPKAPDDEAHGVAVCARHHRLSQAWRSDSKVHRIALRIWLTDHYPDVWLPRTSDGV